MRLKIFKIINVFLMYVRVVASALDACSASVCVLDAYACCMHVCVCVHVFMYASLYMCQSINYVGTMV